MYIQIGSIGIKFNGIKRKIVWKIRLTCFATGIALSEWNYYPT